MFIIVLPFGVVRPRIIASVSPTKVYPYSVLRFFTNQSFALLSFIAAGFYFDFPKIIGLLFFLQTDVYFRRKLAQAFCIALTGGNGADRYWFQVKLSWKIIFGKPHYNFVPLHGQARYLNFLEMPTAFQWTKMLIWNRMKKCMQPMLTIPCPWGTG